MSPHRSRPGDRLSSGSTETVVCVVHASPKYPVSAKTISVLLEHTPDAIPLLLTGFPEDSRPFVPAKDAARVSVLRAPAPVPPKDWFSQADLAAGSADLVVLSSSCLVPAGWLERLRAAALSGDTIATATPLSTEGGSASLPGVAAPSSDELIAAAAILAYPRLQIGGPHCLYIRRRALELIGWTPRVIAYSLRDLTASLCERCVAAGLLNVVADDLYITNDQYEQAAEKPPGRASNLSDLDRGDDCSPLQRTLLLSRAAVSGLAVTVDARSLGTAVGGTQRYTLELALALARFTDTAVRVVVAPDVGSAVADTFAATPGIEVITYDEAVAGVAKTHIVHRPQQVFSADDLSLLRLLGQRLVVTHQDLIAYHNSTYHETLETWEGYRRITRIALAAADRVVFFSEDSRRDAEAEDLVTADRCDVVGAALAPQAPVEPTAPVAAPPDEFILCLGADYRHKNRRFAILLAGALRAGHNWPGQLVLAGAHVPHGASAPDEQDLLDGDPALRSIVMDLGSVTDRERAWLFAHARAIVVPSVVEGFGLVPLEAAAAGVPCLFADQSSLAEVVSGSLASLVPWDPRQSAVRVMPLLHEGTMRQTHIEVLRRDVKRWSWDRLSAQLVATYEQALRMPYRAATTHAWQELKREQHLVEVDRDLRQLQLRHHELMSHLGDRVPLASDEGVLTVREQEGLLWLGAHPALARATLRPLSLLGSIRSGASILRRGA